MSIKNKIENKRARRLVREEHKQTMELLGNFKKNVWMKIKNKYGNFIYKLIK